VVIADEVQDLSANQIRALLHVAADPCSVTFVLDAAQRIYPRGFTWREVGLSIRPSDTHRLANNYRNTAEICRFAQPLLNGLEIGDDGTFPDFNSCRRHGPKPLVLKGLYRGQADYAMRYLRNIDLSNESVAFLHPLGGGWFATLRSYLNTHNFAFVELTRQSDWPDGPENIALSTMHSAKGLEFDHVILLGLNSEVTPHGSDPNDSARDNHRRLLAMAITRARRTVVVGYKPSEASQLTAHFEAGTYEEVRV
jgi:superfamily I DNA/RNA helicase